jgi:hypothetical protein
MDYEIDLGAVREWVGAITGPAALVLAWISYRRSQQFKRLDLRLELRKQVSDLRALVDALPDLLERARESRNAMLGHMGQRQRRPPGEEVSLSHDANTWLIALQSDFQEAKDLVRKLPEANETYQRLKHQDLETMLVEVHALATRAAGLRDKYQAFMAEDDKLRDQLRADVRALG